MPYYISQKAEKRSCLNYILESNFLTESFLTQISSNMWRKRRSMGILRISILLIKASLDPNVFGGNTLLIAALFAAIVALVLIMDE